MKKIERKFKKFLFLLHFVALVNYVYAFYYDFMFIDFPAHKNVTKFGGKFKYLTVINLVIMREEVQVQCQIFVNLIERF
jgi:hypothetical protein